MQQKLNNRKAIRILFVISLYLIVSIYVIAMGGTHSTMPDTKFGILAILLTLPAVALILPAFTIIGELSLTHFQSLLVWIFTLAALYLISYLIAIVSPDLKFTWLKKLLAT
jgi:amino acid permease